MQRGLHQFSNGAKVGCHVTAFDAIDRLDADTGPFRKLALRETRMFTPVGEPTREPFSIDLVRHGKIEWS